MKPCHAIAVLLLAAPIFASAQQKAKKHSDVSALFGNARYVYVESEAGDITRPGLYPGIARPSPQCRTEYRIGIDTRW